MRAKTAVGKTRSCSARCDAVSPGETNPQGWCEVVQMAAVFLLDLL